MTSPLRKFPTLLLLSILGLQVCAQSSTRIISYNILEGMKTDATPGKQAFVEWVKGQDPDILALQECNKFTQASLSELARRFGHPYAIIVKEKGYPTGITSKYPIENAQKFTNNITHGFIMARIKGLDIVVLHLNPHSYAKRRQEMDQILGELTAAPSRDKWVVMGDFNSVSPLDKDNYADGKVLAQFQSFPTASTNLLNGKTLDFEVQRRVLDYGLKDSAKVLDVGGKITGKRIDYIYVSEDLMPRVTKAEFIRDTFTAAYSDHLPLILELKN